MYKGVGGWEGGGVGVGGGWEAGGGLHRPTGLFGVAMSPRSASHRPRHDWRALTGLFGVAMSPRLDCLE